MFTVGDGVNSINASIENVSMNCNSVAGCSYIRARGIIEQSRFRDLTLYNQRSGAVGGLGAGILIDGTAVVTSNWELGSLNFNQFTNADAGDCIGVLNGAGGGMISRVSCVSTAVSPIPFAGIHFSGTAGTQAPYTVRGDSHSEKMQDALLFDNSGGISVIADGVSGQANTTNTLRITATALGQISARHLLNNNNNAANFVVRNQNSTFNRSIASTNPPADFGYIRQYNFDSAIGDDWEDVTNTYAFSNLGLVGSTSGVMRQSTGATASSWILGNAGAARLYYQPSGPNLSVNRSTDTGVIDNAALFAFDFVPTATGITADVYNGAGVVQRTGQLPVIIASGTAAMTTAAIAAGACGTTVTVAAPNVLATDTITWSFNAAPGATNLGIEAWPTAGNVNFQYCSATAVTPAAATLNWRVVR